VREGKESQGKLPGDWYGVVSISNVIANIFALNRGGDESLKGFHVFN